MFPMETRCCSKDFCLSVMGAASKFTRKRELFFFGWLFTFSDRSLYTAGLCIPLQKLRKEGFSEEGLLEVVQNFRLKMLFLCPKAKRNVGESDGVHAMHG